MTNTDSNYLSDCHDATVYVVGGDEGTNHYECSECKEACNFHPKENTDSPLDDLDEILTAYGGKLERVAQHALQGVVYDEPNPNGKTLKQAIELYCHKQVIEELESLIDKTDDEWRDKFHWYVDWGEIKDRIAELRKTL